MKQFQALITVTLLYTVFRITIDSKFAAEFMQYIVED